MNLNSAEAARLKALQANTNRSVPENQELHKLLAKQDQNAPEDRTAQQQAAAIHYTADAVGRDLLPRKPPVESDLSPTIEARPPEDRTAQQQADDRSKAGRES